MNTVLKPDETCNITSRETQNEITARRRGTTDIRKEYNKRKEYLTGRKSRGRKDRRRKRYLYAVTY
jgi:hypothetical protein